jgi:hypothetical protein
MGKLVVLMVTAFVDMMGGLIVFPLIPFYAERTLGHGPLWTALNAVGLGGSGAAVSLMVMMFAGAQLVSAPFWGRFSDRFGRRPALMVGLGASAAAYLIFAFANSLELLFLCRIVQGAGGGTVGVIQAYVADATEPTIGPRRSAGCRRPPTPAWPSVRRSDRWPWDSAPAAPVLFAATIALVNMAFAWSYLAESNALAGRAAHDRPGPRGTAGGAAPRAHARPRARVAADLDLRHHHGRLPGHDHGDGALPGVGVRRDGADDRVLFHLRRRHLVRHPGRRARQAGDAARGAPVVAVRHAAAGHRPGRAWRSRRTSGSWPSSWPSSRSAPPSRSPA